MIPGVCRREAELLAAFRSPAGLGEEARRHVAGCAGCADALAVERALAPLARRPLPAPLPPASTVLLRARLAARREAIERSVAPLTLWRYLAVAAAVVGVVALGLPALAGGLGSGAAPAMPTAARALAGAGLLWIVLLPFLGRLRAGFGPV